MPMSEFDYQAFQPSGASAADKDLLVKFRTEPMQDQPATLAAGHPVFKDVDWIEIRAPGQTNTLANRVITQRDLQRFGDRYANWKKTQSNVPLEGMPLTEWAGITRAQAEELKYKNVYTVEQLAGMSDNNLGGIMNFWALKNAAKAWLERAKEEAPLLRLQQEVERRDAENLLMKESLASMQGQIEALKAQLGGQNTVTAVSVPEAMDAARMAELIEQAVSRRLESVAQVTPKNKGGRPRRVVTHNTE